jgi:hypothetical protein
MKKHTFSGEMDKVGAVIDIGKLRPLRLDRNHVAKAYRSPQQGTLRQINIVVRPENHIRYSDDATGAVHSIKSGYQKRISPHRAVSTPRVRGGFSQTSRFQRCRSPNITAGKKRLIDFSTPFFARTGLEVLKSTSTFRARASFLRRGDAHETVLGNAVAHSPICA